MSRYAAPDTGPSPVGSAQVVLARTSEPPCFLGRAHPAECPGPSPPRGAARAGMSARRAAGARPPSSGWWRSRRRRIGHRHRTAVTGLDLAPDDEPDRARRRCARVPGGGSTAPRSDSFATAVPRREWYAGGSRPHPRARRSVGGSAAAAGCGRRRRPSPARWPIRDTAQRVQAVGVRRVAPAFDGLEQDGRGAQKVVVLEGATWLVTACVATRRS